MGVDDASGAGLHPFGHRHRSRSAESDAVALGIRDADLLGGTDPLLDLVCDRVRVRVRLCEAEAAWLGVGQAVGVAVDDRVGFCVAESEAGCEGLLAWLGVRA